MASLMLFLAATAISGGLLARHLARAMREPLTRLELAIGATVLSLALWLAHGWMLALLGIFRWQMLLAGSIAIGLLSVAVAWRSAGPPTPAVPLNLLAATRWRKPVSAVVALPAAIAVFWIAYSAAALWVLPVSNHDALSYHFPKAVWLSTTGQLGLYPSQDLRVTYSPGNYELLAATLMGFLSSDRATGWITTGSLALLVATAFAWIRRTWGGAAAWLTLPLLLASPVLLLHATSHKNDILMAALTLNALVWLGRYAVHGEAGAAVVGLAALGAAASTKFHGLFVVGACSVLLWRAWRSGVWRPAPGLALVQAGCAAILFLLLGGMQYAANLAHTGHLTGIFQSPTPNAMNTVLYPAYWQLPRFAWMLLTAPLFTEGQYFIIPWNGESWFWPAYELYFSHYGAHISVLILLLPWGLRHVRRRLDGPLGAELAGISLAALALVLFNALIGLQPYGGFAFIPRFLFFALPILLAWTWAPWAAAAARSPGLTAATLAAGVAIAAGYGVATVTKDRFSPAAYVELLWRHPEHRRMVFQNAWRAALYVDREAPADATVAIDAGYDGWTYPLYGAALTRRVQVITSGDAPYQPPADVGWVAIDRGFSIVWGHPDFSDMRRARQLIDRGPVPESEQRVYRSLLQNPDFELVYSYPSRFQAVFRRVAPSGGRDAVMKGPPQP